MMRKSVTRILALVAVASLTGLAACGTANTQNAPVAPAPATAAVPIKPEATPPASAKITAGKIRATWITATKDGDNVIMPLDELKKDTIVHFTMETPDGKMAFMAYILDGQTYVRADICPPCRSINFSLEKDILVCDTCFTRFDARTGEGVSGACIVFPKAAVRWEVNGDKLVMKPAELQTAYLNTMKPTRK